MTLCRAKRFFTWPFLLSTIFISAYLKPEGESCPKLFLQLFSELIDMRLWLIQRLWWPVVFQWCIVWILCLSVPNTREWKPRFKIIVNQSAFLLQNNTRVKPTHTFTRVQFPVPSVPTEQSIDRCTLAHKLNDYPICNHKVSIDPTVSITYNLTRKRFDSKLSIELTRSSFICFRRRTPTQLHWRRKHHAIPRRLLYTCKRKNVEKNPLPQLVNMYAFKWSNL